MAHAVIWVFVALLFGVWTLLIWTADTVLGWSGWSADSLAVWPSWIASLQPPVWLSLWVPGPWIDNARSWLLDAGPAIQAALQQMPDMSGWISAVVWMTWIIGAGSLLLMGIAASAVVNMFGPRPAASGGAERPQN